MEYVYIIHAEGTDWYKIGRSKDPAKRSKALAAKTPYETRVLLTIPTPESKALEAYMHDQYSNYRIRGEWFHLTGWAKEGLLGCYAELVQEYKENGVTVSDADEMLNIPF